MMRKHNRYMIVVVITLLLSLVMVNTALAHNAGHIVLPDGQCLNVGSLKEAPYVGSGNPNQLPSGQLDLLPGAGDQFGTRFAALQGSSAVLPGECP